MKINEKKLAVSTLLRIYEWLAPTIWTAFCKMKITLADVPVMHPSCEKETMSRDSTQKICQQERSHFWHPWMKTRNQGAPAGWGSDSKFQKPSINGSLLCFLQSVKADRLIYRPCFSTSGNHKMKSASCPEIWELWPDTPSARMHSPSSWPFSTSSHPPQAKVSKSTTPWSSQHIPAMLSTVTNLYVGLHTFLLPSAVWVAMGCEN